MAAVRSSGLFLLGRPCPSVLPCSSVASSRRHYAQDVKFLKSTDTAHLKRGRGGRSSFSGAVCTIFGATGFIGRYVANRLGKTGTQMIFPYRGDFYAARHLKVAGDLGQVLFCPFHLCDEASIAKAIKHSTVVINLIGKDWPTRNFTLDQVNVEGAARVARICKQEGVERYIHVSALNSDRKHQGVVIEGGSPVLASKGAGEEAVREAFPEAIILRPSDVYGSEDRFLRYYARFFRFEYRIIAVPNGGYGIYKQPVYVGDLAQGIVNAAVRDMDAEGRIYQAVGPRRYELREMVEWFLRVLRRGPESVDATSVVDLKYDRLPIIKAKFNEMMPWSPLNTQTLEKLERESVTDLVSPHLHTLEDLGVHPIKLEDRIEWELRPFRRRLYFEEEVGDFPAPAPPKFVQP